jgi:type IV secretion system protein VirB1
MDGTSFIALATACAPLVAPSTAQAIVAIESSFNPNAIGVVSGVLERQPRNTGEALATARALQVNGWNFSVGLAQINLGNLSRLGLSLPEAFEPCTNLKAMQTLLGECQQRESSTGPTQAGLRRLLSCYYSGNFTTGFRHGYVTRVVKVANRFLGRARGPP